MHKPGGVHWQSPRNYSSYRFFFIRPQNGLLGPYFIIYKEFIDDDELFCGRVDRRTALSLISSWVHCQTFLPSQISDMPREGIEPAQNMNEVV